MDIGGVCLTLRADRCASLFGFGSMQQLIDEEPVVLEYSRAVETGRMREEDFLKVLSEDVFVDMTPAAVKQAWFELLGPETAGMAELVGAMSASGYKLVFLSDISPFHHRCVLDALSFSNLIDSAVTSYEVGALKPSSAMYEAFERHCLGRVPVLYLDDRDCNVQAARQRGWNAHKFTTVESAWGAFKQILPSRGATGVG